MTYFDETAFLQGVGDGFIEQMYQRWLDNPSSVDESWARWFDSLSEDGVDVAREARGAAHRRRRLRR